MEGPESIEPGLALRESDSQGVAFTSKVALALLELSSHGRGHFGNRCLRVPQIKDNPGNSCPAGRPIWKRSIFDVAVWRRSLMEAVDHIDHGWTSQINLTWTEPF